MTTDNGGNEEGFVDCASVVHVLHCLPNVAYDNENLAEMAELFGNIKELQKKSHQYVVQTTIDTL